FRCFFMRSLLYLTGRTPSPFPAEPEQVEGARRRWLTATRADVISNNATMFNTHRRKPLSALEQILMDYVWANPDCTAESCREGIAGRRALKDSTIRTILRNLETKGYVSHRVEGRTFIYRAADTRRNVAVQAAQQLIDRFCGGSV